MKRDVARGPVKAAALDQPNGVDAGHAIDNAASNVAESAGGNDVDAAPYLSLYNCDGLDYVAIVLGIIGAAVNGVTFPLFAVVFGALVNQLADTDNPDFVSEMNQISLYFVYLAIATLVASFFEVAMFMWSGQRQTARLRQRYLEAALLQDITYYECSATTGDVLSGLNEDCLAVQNAISEKVGNTIHHAVTFCVSIIISLVRGWKLALVLLALTPLIAAAGFVLAKIMTWGVKKMSAAYARANVQSTQTIGNIRTVASFQAEQPMFDKYMNLLSSPAQLAVKIYTYSGIAGGMVNAAIFITYGLAFWYGAKLVREEDDYNGGIVMNVIFGAIIGGFSLGQAAPNFSSFFTGRVAGGRIQRIIQRSPAINIKSDGLIPTQELLGNIDLRDVHFSYPARPDVKVFNGLNLTVGAGQKVALVGASGSGKSTVIQLLQRFYDPASGVVSIDDHDLRSLQLEWLRGQVGLVSQEPVLFATTIKENIAMGRPSATEKEIEAAAYAANAARFIDKLPQRYDTFVGERGVQLSGGQKQRIAIARALLKNPRILLLDEATSALDTVSERLVQAALERLATGRTTVIVAHRLSTIRNADKIAVIRDGEVVEEGSHTELFANELSVYHSLVKLQEQAMDKRAEGQAAAAADEEDADAVDLAHGPGPSQTSFEARRRSTASFQAERPTFKGGEAEGANVEKANETKAEEGELSDEEKKVKVGFLRLIQMNRSEWPYLGVGIVASAALGCVMPLFAIFLSSIIGTFYLPDSEAKPRALRYSLYFYALAVGFLLAASVQGYMFAVVGSRLSHRVRELFYQAVLHMEMGWFDKDENTSGALTSRLSTDAPAVRGATGDVLGIFTQNIVTLLAGYIIAFINGWEMTLVVTATLPLLGFSSYMQMKFFTGLDNKADSVFAEANQIAFEAIHALRTVHSYNLQERVAGLYRSLLEEPVRKGTRNALLSGAAFGTGQFIMFAVYALAFWFGGTRIESGDMDMEQVLKVFFSILLASMGISQAQMSFPDVAKGGKAVARIFRVVDRKSEIDSRDESGEVPAGLVKGEIALHDVSFAYPTRPDVLVFQNFNLRAAASQITALVGESGSGKSTIINLVERFYDPSGGQVLFDGIDIRQLRLSWLRAQVGLVSQEPVLFNGTILENIRIGKAGATLEEVQAACEIANASEFIEKQPEAYGTLLGEGGGISLSGGQKQRIAIARAVLKDPRVLLLDEATSALDAASERLVQDALEKSMKGRTSIVIAHRLTTIRHADKIAVVQRGVVLEEGTHDELMSRGSTGAYVKLARAQAGGH